MFKGKYLAAALLALTATAAHAESASVPAGETSTITYYSSLDDACQTIGKPKAKLMREPQHGKVSFKWMSITLEDAGSCSGKHAKVLAVFYTPKSGFTGEDSFKVGVSTPQYDNGSGTTFSADSYELTVE